jgi:DNA-binding NtrC family response regulator
MEKNPCALRVLVVDDEWLIRWSLAETLAQEGHAVSEACDGKAALTALEGDPGQPDVVLLDYRLPDSNDLTLLAEIRRRAPDAAVILMTAFGTPEIVRGALDLGAFSVVSKPFEVRELAALVEQAHASRTLY